MSPQLSRCNLDVQVVTSSTSAAYYTAKYVSKKEEGGLFDTVEAVETVLQEFNHDNLGTAQRRSPRVFLITPS